MYKFKNSHKINKFSILSKKQDNLKNFPIANNIIYTFNLNTLVPRIDSNVSQKTKQLTTHDKMNTETVFKKQNPHETSFIIVTSKIIESIAINLKMLLTKNNVKSYITYMLTDDDINNQKSNTIYIIIYNSRIDLKLPKNYIYYQIEQSNYKNLNLSYINNSNIIWDFSIKNYKKYNNNNNFQKLFYMPMPFYFEDNTNIINDKYIKYDIFFYGACNKRRKLILTKLNKKYNNKIKIGFGIFDKERDYYIKSSKIIINLHYYDDAAIETARFNEVLQYNKLIISETSPHKYDYYNRNIYKEFVEFVNVIDTDISELCSLIDMYLNNEELYNDKIKYIKENKHKLRDISEYFLKRNLLSIIEPSKININYTLNSNNIYCLHLPETPNRYTAFTEQPNYDIIQYNIEIYPAIKYSPGWKGCAFSYINLIYNAKLCNLKQITICEDDCCFNNDFNNKYSIILEFLEKLNNWDIFVGILAELPKDTTLSNIYSYKNMTFIEINKMHSAVFNIYNNSCFDKILEWDIKTTSADNQIDQYIKQCNFRIIVPVPFEFSCLNVDSTLWGKNMFDEYNNMFENSNKTIEILMDKYLQNNKIIYL